MAVHQTTTVLGPCMPPRTHSPVGAPLTFRMWWWCVWAWPGANAGRRSGESVSFAGRNASCACEGPGLCGTRGKLLCDSLRGRASPPPGRTSSMKTRSATKTMAPHTAIAANVARHPSCCARPPPSRGPTMGPMTAGEGGGARRAHVCRGAVAPQRAAGRIPPTARQSAVARNLKAAKLEAPAASYGPRTGPAHASGPRRCPWPARAAPAPTSRPSPPWPPPSAPTPPRPATPGTR
jgi:hypothetical protein